MNEIFEPQDRRALLKNALVALEEMQVKLDAVEQAKREPIAIVGLGCRFPGGANSPELYWQFLHDGVDLVGPVPPERWSDAAYRELDIDPARPMASWQGGFLDHIDEFDPQFFGIIPREANTMDPQQRLLLEVAWEALENAGIPADKLNGSLTGVFVGVTTNDYATLTRGAEPNELDVYVATGSALNVIAGRLAYILGLQGPSLAVDTACSSSLVAIHLACQSLRNGESDMAIAGGVNAVISPEPFLVFNKWGMMATDGRCKTFDSRADGFVRAEGCGVVVLKRLSDAQAQGDRVLAVIRGSAVNQDGRSTGLTAPNGLAQQRVLRSALANAGVQPHEISYIEAHGTGTSLGDPIEVEALSAVLGQGRAEDHPLLLGSVKTNIGHAESAAGVAGLIKTVLALQHGVLPPHLHMHERSASIPWPDFPVIIPTEPTTWEGYDGKRVAGVSAFGFSGTNAHVIVEGAPAVERPHPAVERPRHVITLSARSREALRARAEQLASFLEANPSVDLGDVGYTANRGRAHFNHRLALQAATPEEAAEKLGARAAGEEVAGVAQGVLSSSDRPRVVFLFTGQGAQYAGMGRALYATQPTFRAALDKCDELLKAYLRGGILPVLWGEVSGIDETAYTQPALFALEYALAQMWQGWGVTPHAVLGHSVGEMVAACVAGVFSLEDGVRLIAERGRLMGALPSGGAMAAVFAEAGTVAGKLDGEAEIATLNGAENTVISGSEGGVEAVIKRLAEAGIKAKRLKVSHAFHSALMEPMLAEWEQVVRGVKLSRPKLRLVTNVTGRFAGEEISEAGYWVRQVREAVQFAQGMATLGEAGYGVYVEIGPNPTLVGMGQRVVEGGVWLPSLREGRDEWEVLLGTVGKLYVNGVGLEWAGYDGDYERRVVSLPTYPYQRQRYWVANKPQRSRRASSASHPLLGTRLDLPGITDAAIWECEISLDRQPYLNDHQVQNTPIVPATAYLEMAVSAAVEAFGSMPLSFTRVQNKMPMYLNEGEIHQVQLILKSNEAAASYEVYSRLEATNSEAGWTLHVSGNVERVTGAITPSVLENFDADTIIARCNEELSGAEFYQRLAEKGNQWGPAFQGIEHLWRGKDEALSLVRVSASVGGDLQAYLFHPAVADACGHVLTATISLDPSTDERGGAFVGAGVDETRVFHPIRSTSFWCYARLRPETSDSNLLIGDVAVYDEDGLLISETIGARLWFLDSRLATAQQLDSWLYEINWKPVATEVAPQRDGIWLIFADASGVGDALAAHLRENGGQSILVYPGTDFERLNEWEARVRPGHEDDLVQLLQSVSGSACQGIVFLWSANTPSSEDLTLEGLAAAQSIGSQTVLCLVQALTRIQWKDVPRLWLVTAGAQAVVPDESVSVAFAPLWGLGRTLALEYSNHWGGLIDLDPHTSVELAADQLWQGLWRSDNEDQVAFRDGNRYAPRLTRHRNSATQPFEVRSDSAYVITGGLGGLGLEVARWLTQSGANHLILIGRTPLPPRNEWAMVDPESRDGRRIAAVLHLEALGASVHIVPIDIGESDALKAFVKTYTEEGRPSIRGVVHAAGIMQYQMLREHTITDMQAIYAPKVAGSWLLHEMFADTPLDFFVMFSSISAILSSPLMGSYAAANSFMDALAHHRRARGLPALSINWATWREVGMAASVDAPTQSLDVSQSLSNEEGLAALGRLISSDIAQASVMPIDWRKWQQKYPAIAAASFLSDVVRLESASPRGKTSADRFDRQAFLDAGDAERRQLIETHIGKNTSRILGFTHSDLDLAQPLATLGIDSLMALELRNAIEADFGVVISMTSLLQGPSITALSHEVLQLMESNLITAVSSSGKVTSNNSVTADVQDTEDLLDEVDRMTEDQVNALLESLLTEEERPE